METQQQPTDALTQPKVPLSPLSPFSPFLILKIPLLSCGSLQFLPHFSLTNFSPSVIIFIHQLHLAISAYFPSFSNQPSTSLSLLFSFLYFVMIVGTSSLLPG